MTFMLVGPGRTGALEGDLGALTSPRWPLWPLRFDRRWHAVCGLQVAPVPGALSSGTLSGIDPLTTWQVTCFLCLPVINVLGTSSFWEDLKGLSGPFPEFGRITLTCCSLHTVRLSVMRGTHTALWTGCTSQGLLSSCLTVPGVKVPSCALLASVCTDPLEARPSLPTALIGTGTLGWVGGRPRPRECCVVYENVYYT